MGESSLCSTSELHEQLRNVTRVAHRQLDHHPLLAALVQPEPTLADYRRALAALHGIHASAHHVVTEYASFPGESFDLSTGDRLAALSHDLAQLGQPHLPLHCQLAPPVSNAELIGLLYVLEGSCLGGRHLYRHLRARLNADIPFAFFAGRGDGTEARWKEFWTFAISRCPVSGYAAAASMALATFAAIKEHLDLCSQFTNP